MRKLAFTVMLLVAASAGFAQKKNVSKAENNLYEPMDLKAAQTAIEQAMQDPTTKDWVKTYYVAGRVYGKIYDQEDNNRMLQKSYSQEVMTTNLVKSVDAYIKAGELDRKPDEKGKVKMKYTKDIKKALKKSGDILMTSGAAAMNDKDNETAVKLFSKYLEIPGCAAMQGEPVDTMTKHIKYYVISAAWDMDQYKDLKIKCMEELKSEPAYKNLMYRYLYTAYMNNATKADTAKAFANLQEGLKEFPNDEFLISNMINYYIFSGKEDEAIKYLDQAIANNPKDAQFYSIKAKLYLDNKKDVAAAKTILNQALAVDANNFIANYTMGRAFAVEADKMYADADKIMDNKKYKVAKDKADAKLKESLPFFEKAFEINPKDADMLYALKAVYVRLGMDASKVNAAIEAL